MKTLQQILAFIQPAPRLKLLMFVVVCYCLSLNLSFPRQPDYNEFNTSLERSMAIEKRSTAKRLNAIEEEGKTYRERYTVYLEKAYNINACFLKVTANIDSIKSCIDPTSTHKYHVSAETIDYLDNSINQFLKSIGDNISQNIRDYLVKDITDCLFKETSNKTLLTALLKDKTANETYTLLTVIQNNITLSNEVAIQEISKEAGGCNLICDIPFCVAIPLTCYVQYGDKVKAQMFIGNYNKATNPTFTTNRGHITKVENGLASLIANTKYPGLYQLYGTATLEDYDDTIIRPWSTQYYVANQGVFMNICKPNYCYRGMNNTVTLNYPGYEADKLSLRADGAKVIKLSDGRYNIIVDKSPKEITAYMDGINPDGSKSVALATKRIIVANPPPPIACVGDNAGGHISLKELTRNNKLSVTPRDEDIDMVYSIKSYQITCLNSKSFTEAVTIEGGVFDKDIISKLQHGDRIYFTDIVAADKNGKMITVPPVAFVIE
ncbi:MAG: hypothetical protein JST82_05815 [Bacteroidetes bacterium]|nr:hypothetical protein [Bacteroidota bacterium]